MQRLPEVSWRVWDARWCKQLVPRIKGDSAGLKDDFRGIAGGKARTHTALRPLVFESSASANSATPARRSLKLRNQKRSSSASDLLNRDAHQEIRPPDYMSLPRLELRLLVTHMGSSNILVQWVICSSKSISSAKRFAWKIPVATLAQYRAVSALTCSPTATGICESKS